MTSSRDPYTIRILLGAYFLSNSYVQTTENTHVFNREAMDLV